MNGLKRMLWCLIAIMTVGTVVRAGDIDLMALTQETQKMSQKPDEMTMAWWVPEEFWQASFAQTPGMSAGEVEGFLKVLRPYTMVAVVDGTIGTFGGVTYRPEDWVRANTRLIDAAGTSYAPRTEDQVDADTKSMLQMIKPLLVNMLGPMGQNMHFLLFPATTRTGERLAVATEKGSFEVKVGTKQFEWHLPVDAVLPTKFCAACQRDCKGSWTFCPWCGKQLQATE